jgi:hypothetical protein
MLTLALPAMPHAAKAAELVRIAAAVAVRAIVFIVPMMNASSLNLLM